MLIYKATNKISGRCYIGKTIQPFNRRINNHRYYARKGIKNKFYDSIRSYGFDVFEWEVICKCRTKEELNEREKFFIKKYSNNYNMTEGGDGGPVMVGKNNPNYGKKFPEWSKRMKEDNPSKRPEVRKKISESKKGKKNYLKSLHMKRDNPNQKEEVKEKIRKAHMGKKRPDHSKRMKELWANGKYNNHSEKLKRAWNDGRYIDGSMK